MGTGELRDAWAGPATLILAAGLAVVAMVLVIPVVVLAGGHTEAAERAAYAAALLVAIPAATLVAILASPRLGSARACWVGAAMLGTSIALLAVLRIVDPGRSLEVLAVAILPAVTAVVLGVLRATRGRVPDPGAAAGFALLALAGGALAFAQHAALRPWRVAVALAVAAAASALVLFWPARPWQLASRPWQLAGRWAEVLLAALLVLLIIDVQFHPTIGLIGHHGFYMGPVADIRHGHAMLVDNFSQYGVGVMYALAAWFAIVPFGFGTFSLLLALLAGLTAVVQLLIVRVATGSRTLALLVLALIAVVVVFGEKEHHTEFPSTGALRFGLPYALVLGHLLGARTSGATRAAWPAELVILGLASLWSIETFGYTAAALLAMLAADALVADGPWTRSLARRVGQAFGVVLASQLAFAIGTRLAAGAWPEWGTYAALVRRYAEEGFGALLVAPWSSGLAVGGAYGLSLAALVAVAVRASPTAKRHRLAYCGAAGLTALGVVSFTYFLGRSDPNNVFHVASPLILTAALWLHIVGREAVTAGRPRLAALGAGVATLAASLAVLPSLPALRDKAPRSAVAAIERTVAADGNSLPAELRTLWSNPPIWPGEPTAEAFIVRLGTPGRRVIILLHPFLVPELLVRMDRSNGLPITTPDQDTLSPEAYRRVHEAIARLRPGALLVIDALPPPPALRPRADFLNGIEADALLTLQRRFRLHPFARDPIGIAAFRLDRR